MSDEASPSIEDFIARVKALGLGTPVLRQSSSTNFGASLLVDDGKTFLNWSYNLGSVMVGIIGQERLTNLDEVTQRVVPRLVSIFNQIYTERHIDPQAVDISVRIAQLSSRASTRKTPEKF